MRKRQRKKGVRPSKRRLLRRMRRRLVAWFAAEHEVSFIEGYLSARGEIRPTADLRAVAGMAQMEGGVYHHEEMPVLRR